MATSNINEYLEALLDDVKQFSGDELKKLIVEAKNDNRLFIRHMGELTEEFIKQRALGRLTDDELRELMEDLVDLNKLQFHKMSSDAKVRAQRIADGITNLILNRLLALI